MTHKPFTLFKRLTANGKITYYVRFCYEEGNRLTGRSSDNILHHKNEQSSYRDLGFQMVEENLHRTRD